jgi:hypothetical protein
VILEVGFIVTGAVLVWATSLWFTERLLARQDANDKDPRLALLKKTHERYLRLGLYSDAVEVHKRIVQIMDAQQ